MFLKDLTDYFRGQDRRSATILLSSVVLMVIYLYQGNHNFLLSNTKYVGKSEVTTYKSWELTNGIHHTNNLENIENGIFHFDKQALTLAQIYQCFAAFFLWALIPILLIKFLIKDNLKDYGICLGDWRFGLKFFLLSIPILLPLLYLTSLNPEFPTEYPLAPLAAQGVRGFILWELTYLVYYLGFEFIFRGYMQLGLLKRLGPFLAIMAQTIPSTIVHWGKPEGETIAAIVAGLAFGALAIRTRSILWGLLVHYFVGIATDFFCLLQRL
ncbi:MAG: type II CAAX endopeptidase family protein [Proteobacteria bacterium]|nr:type II CAAX endopeptidase family protein [Pseudomonadota bacterium]